MKNVIMATLLCGLSANVCAQEKGALRWGAGISINSNTLSNYEDAKSKIGVSLGVKGDYFFTDNLYLGSGLFWTQKGIKDYGDKLIFNYLELPVHIGYRHQVADNVAVFGEFGPYFAYALNGKRKLEGNDPDEDFFKNNKDGHRFDAGLGIHAGVEFNQFQVRLGYDFGLTGIEKTHGNQKAQKHGTFSVGAAYFF